ncbi:phage tail protein [Listeria seeligeri]|uniref:phage tail protein n=1 Tax=Listeria seeligeri TaxID=1640 RepID=UPI0018881CC0|nr:phage tail protein [Listeria seeligeri]MBF2653969.1 phage tail protein [Listeria seeligeri]
MNEQIDLRILNHEKTSKEILTSFNRTTFSETYAQNEAWSISFTVLQREANKAIFNYVENENFVEYRGELFVIKNVKRIGTGRLFTKEVTAVHQFFTIQDDFQINTKSGTLSIDECLAFIFNVNTKGFTYSIVDINNRFTKIEQENLGSNDLLTLIQEVMTDYNAVMKIQGKLVVICPREDYGNKTENVIRYLSHTDSVDFDVNTYEFKTKITGYGKKKDDGSYYFAPVTYVSQAAEEWGIRVATPLNDERYTDKAAMTKKLKEILQDYPSVTVNVRLKMKYDTEEGDWIRVIYEPLGIDQYIQLVGYTRNPFFNNPPQLVFCNTKKTVIDLLSSIVKT